MIFKGHTLADQINLSLENGVRIKNSIPKRWILSMLSFKETITTTVLIEMF